MITLPYFALFAICLLCVLLGFITGHKNSVDRWIEYEEWKAWKAQEK
jgi:hypothetical protein